MGRLEIHFLKLIDINCIAEKHLGFYLTQYDLSMEMHKCWETRVGFSFAMNVFLCPNKVV